MALIPSSLPVRPARKGTRRTLAVAASAALLLTGLTAAAPAALAVDPPLACVDPDVPEGYTAQYVGYTGAAEDIDIPAGVTEVRIDVCGAEGGASTHSSNPEFDAPGGPGGATSTTLALSGPVTLSVLAGEAPAPGASTAAFGGGGASTPSNPEFAPGSGGGGSYVFLAGDQTLLVAAGGGGGGDVCDAPGGGGGGDVGEPGQLVSGQGCGSSASPAGGGTQSAGGVAGSNPNYGTAEPGSALQGGGGGGAAYGVGGGGGWFGGGGATVNAGGGGGSGYITDDPTYAADGSISETGVRVGHGAVRISYATPAGLSTTASPGVALGGEVSDTATVDTFVNTAAPTGTVTFTLYGPYDDNCQGAPVFTSGPQPLDGNGQAFSGPFVPAAEGRYEFVASYSGDVNYPAATADCGDPNESVLVQSAPVGTVTFLEDPVAPANETSTNVTVHRDGTEETLVELLVCDTNDDCSPEYTHTFPLGDSADYTFTAVDVSGLLDGQITARATFSEPNGADETSLATDTTTKGVVDRAPGVPTDVQASSTGPNTATITFGAPVDPGTSPITGYIVTFFNTGTGAMGDADLASNDFSHTFTGLPAGTYTLGVRAINDVGEGDPAFDDVVVAGPVQNAAPGVESASPSASPSQSASASASPSASAASPSTQPSCSVAQQNLPLRINTPTINATGLASVTVFGATPGSTVELQGYSQNHYGTATFGNDRTPIDRTGVADANGSVTFSDLRPASNTRVRARQQPCAFANALGQVITVRAQETLQVVRTGTRAYTFSGKSIPARPGGLIISLYRIVGRACAAGVEPRDCPGEVPLGQDRADAVTGEYSVRVAFPARDAGVRDEFVVKTGRDAQNAPGRSNTRSLLIQ